MTEFTLYTDGSGYQDGFSGYCSVFISNIKGHPHKGQVLGAMTGSTVDRAEMTALLEGLEAILSFLETVPKFRLMNSKPTIAWYTDREALAKSVKGEYGRGSSPDLWARLAVYEQQFNILPTWVSRETETEDFRTCDLHASTLRVIIKSYNDTI